MILRIKPYAVNVKYVPSNSLLLTDTLSRAYLLDETPDQPDEFEVLVLDSGNFSEPMLQKLEDETQKDPELQQLKTVVMDWWPHIKDKTPAEIRPFWNYRDEISCYA